MRNLNAWGILQFSDHDLDYEAVLHLALNLTERLTQYCPTKAARNICIRKLWAPPALSQDDDVALGYSEAWRYMGWDIVMPLLVPTWVDRLGQLCKNTETMNSQRAQRKERDVSCHAIIASKTKARSTWKISVESCTAARPIMHSMRATQVLRST